MKCTGKIRICCFKGIYGLHHQVSISPGRISGSNYPQHSVISQNRILKLYYNYTDNNTNTNTNTDDDGDEEKNMIKTRSIQPSRQSDSQPLARGEP
jgi:hypothetical protein